MPPDTAQKNFFISFNKADRGWAEWIAWQLEAAGYTVIIQAWDFRPGMNCMAEMHHALTIAERFLGVLSPHYLSAPFAQQELMSALAKDPLFQQGTIVLVKVQPCELSGLLPVIILIDVVELDEKPARDVLLAGVRFDRAKPLAKPTFPSSTAKIVLRFPELFFYLLKADR